MTLSSVDGGKEKIVTMGFRSHLQWYRQKIIFFFAALENLLAQVAAWQ